MGNRVLMEHVVIKHTTYFYLLSFEYHCLPTCSVLHHYRAWSRHMHTLLFLTLLAPSSPNEPGAEV
jgi:hypothetical protein